MPGSYNQIKAMLAISKASFRAMLRSPQSVFFSLFFPIVLIVIFGLLSGGGRVAVDAAFKPHTDTTSLLYHAILNNPGIDLKTGDSADLMDRLKKGRITALIDLQPNTGGDPAEPYRIHLISTSASQKDLPILKSILQYSINAGHSELITVEEIPGRPYRMIDFYLPGMLGFSLIGSAVFGVAFVFFAFRETLVLKRLYSTPIRRGYIVLGESLARILFQMMTAVILIAFGYYFFHFTLANGWITFIELLLLSFLGLVLFMGFGFIISGVARNQNVIPIYANLFMFPQYFLSGTFFPNSLLPPGLQQVVKFLPLTALNDALRKVSFEGLHIWNVGTEVLILLVWSVIIYALSFKTFKWE
jgi:ABC-2 type transport system permease protein